MNTCPVAAVLSLIDTMRAAVHDLRTLPSEAEVEGQFAVALGRSIDWSRGLETPAKDGGATFARVIKDVLAQNGLSSQARFNYPSAKVLADEIRAAGVPVIANIITADRGGQRLRTRRAHPVGSKKPAVPGQQHRHDGTCHAIYPE